MPARAVIMRFLVPRKKVAKGSCPSCAKHNLVPRALFPHFPMKEKEPWERGFSEQRPGLWSVKMKTAVLGVGYKVCAIE